MSDETSDQYAHGHSADNAIPVKHHNWVQAGRRAELLLTSENGLHYVFSFTSEQAWFAIRKLMEVKSRLSETGKK